MEDLDRVQASLDHESEQLADLAALGLDWDGAVVRQSERFDLYRDALATLRARDLVYECFCSRRQVRAEIENSPSAPHLPPGSYPGTCRTLTEQQRAERRAEGRPPAIRLRASESWDRGSGAAAEPELIEFVDLVVGHCSGGVDDVVLQRNDGVPAYNLAVVVDDAIQGVTQVVRGDDLVSSTPRQIHLQRLLDLPTPEYAHVPLVFGEDGERLSKRHGAVSLGELRAAGASTAEVLAEILDSIDGLDIGAADLGTDLLRQLQTFADTFEIGATGSSTSTFRAVDSTPGFRLDTTGAQA
jgi:glutamyl-tRNA synthetase